MYVNFEFATLLPSPYSRVKKCAKFKTNIHLVSVNSFLYYLSSRTWSKVDSCFCEAVYVPVIFCTVDNIINGIVQIILTFLKSFSIQFIQFRSKFFNVFTSSCIDRRSKSLPFIIQNDFQFFILRNWLAFKLKNGQIHVDHEKFVKLQRRQILFMNDFVENIEMVWRI